MTKPPPQVFKWGVVAECRSKRQNYTGVVRTLKMTDTSVGSGWILQEIHSKVTGSDYKDEHRHFTEAWHVTKEGEFTPDKGRDYFIVPWDYRHEEKGQLQIEAVSWFVPQQVGVSYEKMGLQRKADGVDCALYCCDGKVTEKYHSYHKFVRHARLKWFRVCQTGAWMPHYKETGNEWIHRQHAHGDCEYFVIN